MIADADLFQWIVLQADVARSHSFFQIAVRRDVTHYPGEVAMRYERSVTSIGAEFATFIRLLQTQRRVENLVRPGSMQHREIKDQCDGFFVNPSFSRG